MESIHSTEHLVVIIDDDDREQMKGTHAIPPSISSASEGSPATSSSSSTATFAPTRYPTEHESPEIPSWTSRASFLNLFPGGPTTFNTHESSAKDPTTSVDTFPKPRNVDAASDNCARKSSYIRHLDLKSVPMRNLPIAAPFGILDTYSFNSIKVNPKANLELRDGDFMRVFQIIQDKRTSEVSLRGWIFRRTKSMNGMLELKRNEVCWILHVDENDTRDIGVQGMESVPVSEVVKRRRIRITNRPFPELSYRQDPKEPMEVIINERVLVCRFKYICYYADARARERNDWCEKALERIRAEDCDPSCEMADDALRRSWRGDTIKGGACKNLVPGEVEFLRNERQYRNAGESLENRKRRHSSFSSHDHAQFESETRRGSVASLITELDLAEADDLQEINPPLPRRSLITGLDLAEADDLQEINPPSPRLSLITEPDLAEADDLQEINPPSPRLKLQLSPKRVEADIMQNIDQSPTVESRHQSFSAEDKPDQLKFQDCSKPEFLHAAKRQKTKIQSSRTSEISFIDLTHDDPKEGAQLCSLFESARLGHSRRANFPISPSRFDSPEVVEIRAHIDTSSKLGTIRREYQGQVTSTYLPKSLRPPEASCNSHSATSELSTANSPYATTRPSANKSVERSSLSLPLAISTRPLPTPISQDERRLSSVVGQRYTFGDCFCGAGGTSRGAVDAGLRVEWGFDFNLPACKSYELNYIAANVYNVDAHRFSGLTDQDLKVDICHLSPPCQFFSDAHTVQGKDDDMNTASLFAVFELLNQAKPRVVTLEQTAGLLRRHPIFLNALILMFTARGFSIRWRVIDCADYGLPQRRHRLFMIASCPGESLPIIPKPTHTRDPSTQQDLKPWVTINETISSIPRNCANHDIASARIVNGIPYDGDNLARCMTTSGGGTIHPSGQRNLTIREFACLQGFPLEQKFFSTGAKRQIGNAVPPIVARVVLEEVKRELMKADGVL